MCLINHGDIQATEEHVTRITNKMNTLISQYTVFLFLLLTLSETLRFIKLSSATQRGLPTCQNGIVLILYRYWQLPANLPLHFLFVGSTWVPIVFILFLNLEDIYRRPLASNTGICAGLFEIKQYDLGFVLCFPAVTSPTAVPVFVPDPYITAVYSAKYISFSSNVARGVPQMGKGSACWLRWRAKSNGSFWRNEELYRFERSST